MSSSCISLRSMHTLALGLVGMALAAQLHAEEKQDPAFIADSLFPVGVTQIRSIESLDSADVVMLNTGHAGGLRQGMVVQVWRNDVRQPVADLLIVAARRDVSAALITRLDEDVVLQSGDVVQVKSQSF